jgi:LuxR family maltose regulon positive regulatory protein
VHALTRPAQRFEESLDASIAAGDYNRALEAVATNWVSQAGDHGARLRTWIRQIPEQLWSEDARVIAALGASYRSVDSPGGSAALPHFELAELLIEAGTSSSAELPAVQVQHAAALRGLGRLDAAKAKAECAWAILQAELHLTLPLRLTLQAEASLQLGLINLHSGNMVDAEAQLQLASGLSENGLATTDLVECLGALAFAAYAGGDFASAERHLVRARALAGESPIRYSRFGAPALITETLIAADRNDAARALAGAAALDAAAGRSDWKPLALYARAVTAAINGQLIEALDLQRRSTASAREWEGEPAVRTLGEILRAGLHLQLGETELATALLSAIAPLPDHVSCPGSQLAGIRFSAGDFAGCLDALADCTVLGDRHCVRTFTDVLLLTAAANYELGRLVTADVAFDQALYLGSRTGIRVPFLVLPRLTMLRMLNRAADRYQPDAVELLLDELRVGSASSGELAEPLSDRELEIAQHLFQDKTAGQIAAELYISVNTVKTHVRSIYRKLSATNRKEAVKRVHELGLDVRITPF